MKMMNSNPDDLLALKIAKHMRKPPEVSSDVSRRLKMARVTAMSKVRRERNWLPSSVNSLMLTSPTNFRRFGVASLLALIVASAVVASMPARIEHGFGYQATDDDGSYPELLQDY